MKKKYLIPAIITIVLLSIVFFIKRLFPFGNKIIAWGDMHVQVTALYYYLHDIVFNGKSIFSMFNSGIVTNAIANISYYILSPLSVITLFFKRVDIPQSVNIIILLKIVLSSITCNYFLDKQFPKISNFYKIFFSVLYAMSSYNLSYYIITGWIDIVYLFPILMIGLISLLNEKKVKLFIIILSICLIFNFYISFLCILFIFIGSFIYLLFYHKDKIKEALLLLSISVILSLLISSFILVPILIQILSSSRMGFNFQQLFNSRFGPVVDKLVMMTSLGAMISCNILMIKNYKKNKKCILFFLVIISLITIPIFIEPVNKMLHLGSYMYYPYRYGFITTLLFIISSCIYIEKDDYTKKSIFPIIVTIITNIFIIYLTYRYYNVLQKSVFDLSFSYYHKSFYIMMLIFIFNLVSYIVIFYFNKKDSKTTHLCLLVSLIVFAFSQSMLYIGIDTDEKTAHKIYDNMNSLYKYDFNSNYHIKKDSSILIENYGYIIDRPTQDFWTSLTDNNMFIGYQKLGYDSSWMNTSSNGGNLFIDSLLSNKYYLTDKKQDNSLYSKKDSFGKIYIYESKIPISNGYLINKNNSISKTTNPFKASNIIYKSLTGEEDIFDINKKFKLNNIKYEKSKVEIIDKNKEASLTSIIDIKDKKVVYLDISKPYENTNKAKLYSSFDIYVNDKLLINDYPKKLTNGTIELGVFEGEKLRIKLIMKKPIINNIYSIQIGLLDYNKLTNYFKNNKTDLNIKYKKNSIKTKYYSKEEKTLFMPIPYINGLTAKNNNKEVEIIKVFDYFVGIKVNKGNNNISISYITPGLKIGLIISLVGIIMAIIFIKYKNMIVKSKILKNIVYYAYVILYIGIIVICYIFPIFIFLASFLK